VSTQLTLIFQAAWRAGGTPLISNVAKDGSHFEVYIGDVLSKVQTSRSVQNILS
jgi:hypothetical protein